MKASMYNFFTPYRMNYEQVLAYNSYSNALAVMDQDSFAAYQHYIAGDIKALNSELMYELKRGSFLIDDNVDELVLIRHNMMRARYGSDTLALTLAPTSFCNFRCVYCYEKGSMHGDMMSIATQDAIVSLLEHRAPYISHLGVTWYGGEPLMAIDIIESLTNRFLALTEKHGIVYSADIVTNGYLLSATMAQRLKQCGVKGCQITLDGDAETHNRRRPLASGKETYNQIINNLAAVDDIIPGIVLRVNIDENISSAIHSVVKTIHQMGLRHVTAYPAPIRNTNDCYKNDGCFTRYGFQDFEYNYLSNQDDQMMFLRKYPTRRLNACCADSTNAHVINADGEMYKCWSDIGIKSLSVGNVRNSARNLMNEVLYLKDDPTRDPECCDCKFLPVCLGGCPHERREKSSDRCVHREMLHELYLNKIAHLIISEKRPCGKQ